MFNSILASIDVIIIFYGLAILIINFVKPDWYWKGKMMQRRRDLIGDEKTSRMYYITGAIMIGVGIMMRAGYL